MRTLTFNLLHDLSAVYTGAFKASPSAKQARSPNDNPRGRVSATRSPASLACSEVKATASRMGLNVASHASSGLRPRSTNLPCTSAKLTVLIAAALNSSGVSLSAPGSRLRIASRAEASSTTLFISRGLVPFLDQFVDKRRTWLHMLADKTLSPLNIALQGGDAQFVVFNLQNYLVSNTDAQLLANGSRNDHAPILIDPHAGLRLHSIHLLVTLFYRMSYSVENDKQLVFGRAPVSSRWRR